MFTQSCFIQLNCQTNYWEIIKELKKIGYKKSTDCFPHHQYIICINGEIKTSESISLYLNDWGINCIDNKKLFLALASLRDDTDLNQWMICKYLYKYSGYLDVKIGDWVLCNDEKCLPLLLGHFKKATVKEIKEHFK